MSEFAKRQLKKYGWTEGKGLGKEENGIVNPIKTVLKFDNHGIGHDDSKLWTSRWWCNVFNDASKRISVTNHKAGVQVHCEKKAIESELPSDAVIHKRFVKSGTIKVINEHYTKETESVSPVSNNIRDDLIYSKCEGIKKKCFNYSLVKGKINRTEKQEKKFFNKNRLIKGKARCKKKRMAYKC